APMRTPDPSVRRGFGRARPGRSGRVGLSTALAVALGTIGVTAASATPAGRPHAPVALAWDHAPSWWAAGGSWSHPSVPRLTGASSLWQIQPSPNRTAPNGRLVSVACPAADVCIAV